MVKESDKENKEMRCISWNVNGLRACMKKGFSDFFSDIDADIFAIQETKMQPDQMSEDMHFDGYYEYMNSAERKGYAGTLVYTKEEPLSVSYEISGDTTKEGRVITLEYDNFYFVCAYVPNSKEELARLGYRIEWEGYLRKHLKKLNKKKPVIYTGDFNVAHEEIDLRHPSNNHHNAGFTDEEREAFGKLLKAGFTDSFRYMYPEEEKYSWWSYRFNARKNNAGWRIDYFVVSDSIKDDIKDAYIFNEIEGSDHCPIGLDIEI